MTSMHCRIRLALVAAAFTFAIPDAGDAQVVTPVDLSARVEHTELLPSRIPVQYVIVDLQPIIDENESLNAVRTLVANPANWVLRRRGESRRLNIGERVLLPPDSTEPTAYLILRRGVLEKGDTLEVGILKDGKLFTHSTGTGAAPVNVTATLRPLTFQFDPKQVPDQKLLGGGAADVIQFGLKLEVPSLLANGGLARVYVRSNTLLSTDERDVATRLQGTVGAELSLLRSWYVPGFVDMTVQTNQRFSNSSLIVSTGVRSILPWGWTRSILWNSLVRAPISPEISLSGQYQRRMEVDTLVAAERAKDNVFRIAGLFDWRPVHLLPGRVPDKKDITLEPTLRGWYFPHANARGGTSIREFEGHVDMALYVPVSGFPSGFLLTSGSGEDTLTRLKIQYVSGANEANGFARSSEWKIGFEVSK
ncbi:MAG TPA: hypothetical protein VHG93_09730 [Longimicrobium sp.]|nr:hypothetical protein [Longimicrobium sp.]